MKYIYIVHILNLEDRHSYYSTGISSHSIPFQTAKRIEFLQINLRSKEKKNVFPHFLAFLSTYKKLYKHRHSIQNLFKREISGQMPRFSFQNSYKKFLTTFNQHL